MSAAFNAWVASELDRGMVDFRFSVLPGKGVSVAAVQAEVLAAEACLKAGFVRTAPQPQSVMPDHIARIVAQTAL